MDRFHNSQAATRVNIYSPGDYLKQGLHWSAMTGLAIGAGVWAGFPALLFSGTMSAVVTVVGARYYRKLNEGYEERLCPNIVKDGLSESTTMFSKKLGLKCEPALQQFSIKAGVLKSDDLASELNEQAEKSIGLLSAGGDRPLIRISDPIMKLLSKDELNSVLAHEFSHIGGKHTASAHLVNLMGATIILTALSGFGMAMFHGGWMNTAASLAAGLAVNTYFSRYVAKKDTKEMVAKETETHRKSNSPGRLKFRTVLTLGFMAIPNPPLLVAAATSFAFGGGARLVAKSYSRRAEFQADRGVVKLGAEPLAQIISLRKIDAVEYRDHPKAAISRDWRSGSLLARTTKMVCSVDKTHPDTMRRCRRLAKLAAAQGQDVEAITAALAGKLDISSLPPLKAETPAGQMASEAHEEHAIDNPGSFPRRGQVNPSIRGLRNS